MTIRAAAMIADIFCKRASVQRLQRGFSLGKAHAYLLYFRLLRLALGFKIHVFAFKCFVLGFDEPKSLVEDRRRAVLVDEFFDKVKHLRSSPDVSE
jgi:hypothetical protein